MAEANRSGILAKAQKRLSRTKTKVLQSLGKADKSTDESFDDLVQKTEKQHEVAHHLQKEIKAYLGCVRALGQASKSLSAAISQTYEEGWTENESFKKNVENLDLLWDDYSRNISEEVMEPLTQYIHSFPALKTRISKRGRKMMDYDNSRHNLEVLNAAKKKDESKVLKAQEDYNECRKIYEELHSELSKELPDFYNSRVTFYAQMFEKFYDREHTLHSEVAKISKLLTQIARKLSTDNKQFVYEPKRPISKSVSENSDDQMTNGEPSPRLGATINTSLSNPVTSPFTTTTVDDEDHLYCNQDELGASVRVNGKAENSPKIIQQTQQGVAFRAGCASNLTAATLKPSNLVLGLSPKLLTSSTHKSGSLQKTILSPVSIATSYSVPRMPRYSNTLPRILSQPLPAIPGAAAGICTNSEQKLADVRATSVCAERPQEASFTTSSHEPVFIHHTYQNEIDKALQEETETISAENKPSMTQYVNTLHTTDVHINEDDLLYADSSATSIVGTGTVVLNQSVYPSFDFLEPLSKDMTPKVKQNQETLEKKAASEQKQPEKENLGSKRMGENKSISVENQTSVGLDFLVLDSTTMISFTDSEEFPCKDATDMEFPASSEEVLLTSSYSNVSNQDRAASTVGEVYETFSLTSQEDLTKFSQGTHLKPAQMITSKNDHLEELNTEHIYENATEKQAVHELNQQIIDCESNHRKRGPVISMALTSHQHLTTSSQQSFKVTDTLTRETFCAASLFTSSVQTFEIHENEQIYESFSASETSGSILVGSEQDSENPNNNVNALTTVHSSSGSDKDGANSVRSVKSSTFVKQIKQRPAVKSKTLPKSEDMKKISNFFKMLTTSPKKNKSHCSEENKQSCQDSSLGDSPQSSENRSSHAENPKKNNSSQNSTVRSSSNDKRAGFKRSANSDFQNYASTSSESSKEFFLEKTASDWHRSSSTKKSKMCKTSLEINAFSSKDSPEQDESSQYEIPMFDAAGNLSFEVPHQNKVSDYHQSRSSLTPSAEQYETVNNSHHGLNIHGPVLLTHPFSQIASSVELDSACGDWRQDFLTFPISRITTAASEIEGQSTIRTFTRPQYNSLDDGALFLTSSFREVQEGGRSDPTLANTMEEVFLTSSLSHHQLQSSTQALYLRSAASQVSEVSDQPLSCLHAGDVSCQMTHIYHSLPSKENNIHEIKGKRIVETSTLENAVQQSGNQSGDGQFAGKMQNDILSLKEQTQSSHPLEATVQQTSPTTTFIEVSLSPTITIIGSAEPPSVKDMHIPTEDVLTVDEARQAWRCAWRKDALERVTCDSYNHNVTTTASRPLLCPDALNRNLLVNQGSHERDTLQLSKSVCKTVDDTDLICNAVGDRELICKTVDDTELLHTAVDDTQLICKAIDDTEILHKAVDDTELICKAVDDTELICEAVDDTERENDNICLEIIEAHTPVTCFPQNDLFSSSNSTEIWFPQNNLCSSSHSAEDHEFSQLSIQRHNMEKMKGISKIENFGNNMHLLDDHKRSPHFPESDSFDSPEERITDTFLTESGYCRINVLENIKISMPVKMKDTDDKDDRVTPQFKKNVSIGDTAEKFRLSDENIVDNVDDFKENTELNENYFNSNTTDGFMEQVSLNEANDVHFSIKIDVQIREGDDNNSIKTQESLNMRVLEQRDPSCSDVVTSTEQESSLMFKKEQIYSEESCRAEHMLETHIHVSDSPPVWNLGKDTEPQSNEVVPSFEKNTMPHYIKPVWSVEKDTMPHSVKTVTSFEKNSEPKNFKTIMSLEKDIEPQNISTVMSSIKDAGAQDMKIVTSFEKDSKLRDIKTGTDCVEVTELDDTKTDTECEEVTLPCDIKTDTECEEVTELHDIKTDTECEEVTELHDIKTDTECEEVTKLHDIKTDTGFEKNTKPHFEDTQLKDNETFTGIKKYEEPQLFETVTSFEKEIKPHSSETVLGCENYSETLDIKSVKTFPEKTEMHFNKIITSFDKSRETQDFDRVMGFGTCKVPHKFQTVIHSEKKPQFRETVLVKATGADDIEGSQDIESDFQRGNETDTKPPDIETDSQKGNETVSEPQDTETDFQKGNETVSEPQDIETDFQKGNETVSEPQDIETDFQKGNETVTEPQDIETSFPKDTETYTESQVIATVINVKKNVEMHNNETIMSFEKDTELQINKTVLDSEEDRKQHGNAKLKNSGKYIEQEENANLKTSKKYTEQEGNASLKTSKKYTEQEGNASLKTSKKYTEQESSETLRGIEHGIEPLEENQETLTLEQNSLCRTENSRAHSTKKTELVKKENNTGQDSSLYGDSEQTGNSLAVQYKALNNELLVEDDDSNLDTLLYMEEDRNVEVIMNDDGENIVHYLEEDKEFVLEKDAAGLDTFHYKEQDKELLIKTDYAGLNILHCRKQDKELLLKMDAAANIQAVDCQEQDRELLIKKGDTGLDTLHYRKQDKEFQAKFDDAGLDTLQYEEQNKDLLAEKNADLNTLHYREQDKEFLVEKSVGLDSLHYKEDKELLAEKADTGLDTLLYNKEDMELLTQKKNMGWDIVHYKEQDKELLAKIDYTGLESVHYQEQDKELLVKNDNDSSDTLHYKEQDKELLFKNDNVCLDTLHCKQQDKEFSLEKDSAGLNTFYCKEQNNEFLVETDETGLDTIHCKEQDGELLVVKADVDKIDKFLCKQHSKELLVLKDDASLATVHYREQDTELLEENDGADCTSHCTEQDTEINENDTELLEENDGTDCTSHYTEQDTEINENDTELLEENDGADCTLHCTEQVTEVDEKDTELLEENDGADCTLYCTEQVTEINENDTELLEENVGVDCTSHCTEQDTEINENDTELLEENDRADCTSHCTEQVTEVDEKDTELLEENGGADCTLYCTEQVTEVDENDTELLEENDGADCTSHCTEQVTEVDEKDTELLEENDGADCTLYCTEQVTEVDEKDTELQVEKNETDCTLHCRKLDTEVNEKETLEWKGTEFNNTYPDTKFTGSCLSFQMQQTVNRNKNVNTMESKGETLSRLSFTHCKGIELLNGRSADTDDHFMQTRNNITLLNKEHPKQNRSLDLPNNNSFLFGHPQLRTKAELLMEPCPDIRREDSDQMENGTCLDEKLIHVQNNKMQQIVDPVAGYTNVQDELIWRGGNDSMSKFHPLAPMKNQDSQNQTVHDGNICTFSEYISFMTHDKIHVDIAPTTCFEITHSSRPQAIGMHQLYTGEERPAELAVANNIIPLDENKPNCWPLINSVIPSAENSPDALPMIEDVISLSENSPDALPMIEDVISLSENSPICLPEIDHDILSGENSPICLPEIDHDILSGENSPICLPEIDHGILSGKNSPICLPEIDHDILSDENKPNSLPEIDHDILSDENKPNSLPEIDHDIFSGENKPNSLPEIDHDILSGENKQNCLPKIDHAILSGENKQNCLSEINNITLSGENKPNCLPEMDKVIPSLENSSNCLPGTDNVIPSMSAASLGFTHWYQSSDVWPVASGSSQVFETKVSNSTLSFQGELSSASSASQIQGMLKDDTSVTPMSDVTNMLVMNICESSACRQEKVSSEDLDHQDECDLGNNRHIRTVSDDSPVCSHPVAPDKSASGQGIVEHIETHENSSRQSGTDDILHTGVTAGINVPGNGNIKNPLKLDSSSQIRENSNESNENIIILKNCTKVEVSLYNGIDSHTECNSNQIESNCNNLLSSKYCSSFQNTDYVKVTKEPADKNESVIINNPSLAHAVSNPAAQACVLRSITIQQTDVTTDDPTVKHPPTELDYSISTCTKQINTTDDGTTIEHHNVVNNSPATNELNSVNNPSIISPLDNTTSDPNISPLDTIRDDPAISLIDGIRDGPSLEETKVSNDCTCQVSNTDSFSDITAPREIITTDLIITTKQTRIIDSSTDASSNGTISEQAGVTSGSKQLDVISERTSIQHADVSNVSSFLKPTDDSTVTDHKDLIGDNLTIKQEQQFDVFSDNIQEDAINNSTTSEQEDIISNSTTTEQLDLSFNSSLSPNSGFPESSQQTCDRQYTDKSYTTFSVLHNRERNEVDSDHSSNEITFDTPTELDSSVFTSVSDFVKQTVHCACQKIRAPVSFGDLVEIMPLPQIKTMEGSTRFVQNTSNTYDKCFKHGSTNFKIGQENQQEGRMEILTDILHFNPVIAPTAATDVLKMEIHSRKDEASGGDAEVSDDDSEETNNVYALPKTSDDSHEGEDEDYQIPLSNMPIKSLPSGTLYQVEATHAYKGEDIDELSFVAGDIINVIPYENDEEQDEGWQMGIMQNDGRKGVFPENFTRRF